MKNRWFPVVILIFILIITSTGCGVSKSEYDAATIELKLVKEDRQALQTQLQEAQSQLTNANTDLVRAEVELEATQDQLEETETDLETTQSQLEKTQTDLKTTQIDLETVQGQLQNANAQVQSMQDELDAARNISAVASSYAEFMDILMFEVWIVSGVTPNFTFSTAGEYQTALKSRADSIGDPQLIGFVSEIESGPVTKDRLCEMWYYCLDRLETILK